MLGCLLHLCTYNGRLVRAFLEGLSLRAVRALLHCSLRDHWAPDVHRQLVSLAAALVYVPQEEQPGERRLPFAVSPRGELFCRCCDPYERKSAESEVPQGSTRQLCTQLISMHSI